MCDYWKFQVGWSTSLASLCDRGEVGGWKMEHFSASLQHKLDEIYECRKWKCTGKYRPKVSARGNSSNALAADEQVRSFHPELERKQEER